MKDSNQHGALHVVSNMDDVIRKLREVNSPEKLNMDLVLACVNCDDELIRCDIVEILTRFLDKKDVLPIVLDMLTDRSYLVRCEACDALYCGLVGTRALLERLLKVVCRDRSSTVRMHAVSTINMWLNQDRSLLDDSCKSVLFAAYARESAKRVLVSYAALWYTLTKDQKYLSELCEYMYDGNYHIRHNSINNIYDILDAQNVQVIVPMVRARLRIEPFYSVSSSLEKLLRECLSYRM